MRRLTLAALPVLAALALTGCAGGASEQATASDSADGWSTMTPVEEYTIPAESDDDADEVVEPSYTVADNITFSCDSGTSYDDSQDVDSLTDAWKIPADERTDCMVDFDVAPSLLELTKTETKALKTAYNDTDPEDQLDTLYAMCAEPKFGFDGEDDYGYGPNDLNHLGKTDAKELQGALLLCPKHKDAKKAAAGAKAALQKEQQREDGTRFDDGTYRVGKDIKAGTYVSKVADGEDALDGCYWERTNANGDIINNNFINSAFRAQVYIAPSDYSFTSERCGEWVRQ